MPSQCVGCVLTMLNGPPITLTKGLPNTAAGTYGPVAGREHADRGLPPRVLAAAYIAFQILAQRRLDLRLFERLFQLPTCIPPR